MNKPAGQVAGKQNWDVLITEFMAVPNLLGLADAGDFLEAHLLCSHYDYLEQGLALIVKLGVPIRGTGKFGRVFHGAKTLCDFVGWVIAGEQEKWRVTLKEGFEEEKDMEAARQIGKLVASSVYTHTGELIAGPGSPPVVPVAFDAKRRDVAGSRGWKWRCGDTPGHQRLALQLVEGMLGGWGFLLVSIEEDGYLLGEARVVRASQLQPGTSVDLRECPRVEMGLQRCDWLPVVREMYGGS